MWSQILPGLRMKLVMTVALGILYPLGVTAICQLLFPKQANGSLVRSGSELIGQSFTKPEYLHPRPSAAGAGYDATASGGSNLGPTSAKLLYGTTKVDEKTGAETVDFDGLSLRLLHYCVENGITYQSSVPLEKFRDATGNLDDVKLIKAFNDATAPLRIRAMSPVPADAITGSASGLDPEISPENASLQAARIAASRGAGVDAIRRLIAEMTQRPTLGILGEARVNVLRVNLALDQRYPKR